MLNDHIDTPYPVSTYHIPYRHPYRYPIDIRYPISISILISISLSGYVLSLCQEALRECSLDDLRLLVGDAERGRAWQMLLATSYDVIQVRNEDCECT